MPSTAEYGDEIFLGGSARVLTEFAFEYYADLDFGKSGRATVRFYANDGPAGAPGTVLYDSGSFEIFPGFQTVEISALRLPIPNHFTWTVRFEGFEGTSGSQAGLILYRRPTVGAGLTDFWQRLPGGDWLTFIIPDLPVHFAARAFAVMGDESSNDLFGRSTVLTGTTVRTSGSNAGAHKEPGEPDHALQTGGKSVWWTWTAPEAGLVTVSTAGSNFDTLLAVYLGATVSKLTAIASSDDAAADQTSRVTFQSVAGRTYHFAVDGFLGATGDIALGLDLIRRPLVNISIPEPGSAFIARPRI